MNQDVQVEGITIQSTRTDYTLLRGSDASNDLMVGIETRDNTGTVIWMTRERAFDLVEDLFQLLHNAIHPNEQREAYGDNRAVVNFAHTMADKMEKKRGEGRGGWNTSNCDPEDLFNAMMEHLKKDDPVDIANFSMMLYVKAFPNMGQTFVDWLRAAVRVHPVHVEQVDEVRRLNGQVTDARNKSYRAEELLKVAQKEREEERVRLERDARIEREAQVELREDLARTLGYIDRVNESPEVSRVGNLAEIRQTPGPRLKTGRI